MTTTTYRWLAEEPFDTTRVDEILARYPQVCETDFEAKPLFIRWRKPGHGPVTAKPFVHAGSREKIAAEIADAVGGRVAYIDGRLGVIIESEGS